MGHAVKLALSLALMGFVAPVMAQSSAPATSPAMTPARVVVFESLTQPAPTGLRIVEAAAAQLEHEFGMRIQEMHMLAQRINEGGPNAEALKRDYDARGAQLSKEIEARQQALFDPVIAKVQASLPAYAAATGGNPVTLVGAQDIAGFPPGAITDVSSAYVVWMNAQP